ncbi:MAG: phosphoenolpyruvate synthase, partial [Bacteroidota bacterium]
MNLRIKIHGQPEGKDALAVDQFLEDNRVELERQELVPVIKELARDIRTAYVNRDLVADIAAINATIPEKNGLKEKIKTFTDQHAMNAAAPQDNTEDRLTAAADLMWTIRTGIMAESPYYRLEAMDISLALERLIFNTAQYWDPKDARELMEKICYLGKAAAGAGYVETWEWNEAQAQLADPNYQLVWPAVANDYLDAARRFVEWGVSTNRGAYGEIVERYAEFEPKAHGFLDDRIRGAVLLPMGNAVGRLGDWVAEAGNLKNDVLDVPNQGSLRGLNPGYAKGRLHVIEGNPDEVEVNPDDVYVFATPPADLKPVGGIATVNEGNMVSHVQLLARNLGIPNAVITDEQFAALKRYDSGEVFYAVSNRGTVLLKPATSMTEEEVALFSVKERSEQRVTVPTDQLRLEVNRVLNMREIRSKDSGKLAGPKAANLGQLKALFPDNVVEGLVIPFGIFREHLDQTMPGQKESYWDFLNNRFAKARQMEADGEEPEAVEAYTLEQLATLREAIKEITLQPALVEALRDSFQAVFGQPHVGAQL